MCSFPRPGIRWCLGHAQGFMFLIQAGAKAKEAARGEKRRGGVLYYNQRYCFSRASETMRICVSHASLVNNFVKPSAGGCNQFRSSYLNPSAPSMM